MAEIEGLAASEASLEALGEGVELARPGEPAVLAVAPPEAAEAVAAQLGAHGAGRVVVLERGGEPARAEADAASVADWLRAASMEGPPVVLLAHTRYGRAVAARLAVELDAALAPDAVAARRAADGGIEITRPAYGERLYAWVRIAPDVPAVVTLRAGALGVGPPQPGRRAPVERHRAPTRPEVRASERRRVIAADPRTVDVREAERIVSVGRGVGGLDALDLIGELADLLGAAIGASRVAVDLGWLPWERQIGQSGRTVSPRLYVAVGISGASQHLLGIQGAEAIVAINADRGAPILEAAHLGVVGDWRPIVGALVERLRARQSRARGSGEGSGDR